MKIRFYVIIKNMFFLLNYENVYELKFIFNLKIFIYLKL